MKKINVACYSLFLGTLFLNGFLYSQDNMVDSLKNALTITTNDTVKCQVLNLLSESASDAEWPTYNAQLKTLSEKNSKTATGELKQLYLKYYSAALSNEGFLYNLQGEMTKAIEAFSQALNIQQTIGYKEGVANTLNNLGYTYQLRGNPKQGLEHYEQSLKVWREIKNKKGTASTLTNISNIHEAQGDIAKALDYLFKALKLWEETNNITGIANAYNNIGGIYKNQGDIAKALSYYEKSLLYSKKNNDKYGMAYAYNNIGSIYKTRGDIQKAISYNNQALKLREEIGDKEGIAMSLNNIGTAYATEENYPLALDYYHKGLTIREEIGDKAGEAISLNSIATVLQKLHKPGEALTYGLESLQIGNELGYPDIVKNSAYTLKTIYQSQNQHQKALQMFELFIQMRDSLNNETTRKSSIQKQFQFEYEKQAANDSIANAAKSREEQLKHDQQIKQQQFYSYGGLLGFMLMLIVAVVSFRAFKNKQKANVLITEQKQLAETQKHIIEEKQKEILDSIHYAQRIQNAILAKEEDIKLYFPESFLLYLPKDIVAGDFYFFEASASHIFYAAVDCTGHGVPGALVSVVCSNALSRCIKEFALVKPGEILDKARELVVDTFKKSGQDVKDGMDISLLVKHISTHSYQWAGANNPLWYIQDNTMKQITANKQPVGQVENPVPFTTHNLQVNHGDTLFLFTDGYADQFGGEKGKKFKYKQLNELLLMQNDTSLAQQKNSLETTFNNWKGKLEQIDDVCIIGIQV